MKRFFTSIAATALVAIVAACAGSLVNKEIVAACGDGRIKADDIIAFWQANQVVRSIQRSDGSATVEIDAVLWRKIESDAQVSIAVAVYCQVKSKDGHGTVTVRDGVGNAKGLVVNGNWAL